MKQSGAYRDWTAHTLSPFSPLHTFATILPLLSLSQRKSILSLCQLQVAPMMGAKSWKLADWFQTIEIPEHATYAYKVIGSARFRLIDVITPLKPFIESPVTAGFISSILRSSPYDDTSFVDDTIKDSLLKEMRAALDRRLPWPLDYSILFSDTSSLDSPLSELHDPNPTVTCLLRSAFFRARERLRHSVLFPRIKRKTVGSIVARNFYEGIPSNLRFWHNPQDGVLASDLERAYHEYGYEIPGPVEIRSGWKYNVLKPRIYYALGGDTYHASKYISEVIETILEEFEVVHPVGRFFEPSDVLSAEDTCLIYDYASFTSSFDECPRFWQQLGNFLRGVPVTIVDTFVGPRVIDLGELCLDYNSRCNLFSEFDLSRFLPSEEAIPLFQHNCGMLGVPGNIFGDTLVHGINICYLTGSIHSGKSVGDDAKLYLRPNELKVPALLRSRIEILGVIHPEKYDRWDYTDEDEDIPLQVWKFVKRPYFRLQNTMHSGILFNFPTLDAILGPLDDFHFQVPEKDMHDLGNRQRKFYGIWVRLLQTLTRTPLEDCDREFLYHYQKACFGKLQYPRDARAGFFLNKSHHKVRSPPWMTFWDFGRSIDKVVAESYGYDEEVEVQSPGHVESEWVGYVDEKFLSSPSRKVSLLEKLGYLSKEIVYTKISRKLLGDDDLFSRYILGFEPCHYLYTVERSVPSWIHCI